MGGEDAQVVEGPLRRHTAKRIGYPPSRSDVAPMMG
jgi:hypothetical protein